MRHARSGDASIADQALGDRDPDLLFVPGFAAHLDLAGAEPKLARYRRGLAGSFEL